MLCTIYYIYICTYSYNYTCTGISTAVVTNYQNSGFKLTNLLCYNSGGQKPKMDFTGPKTKHQQGYAPSDF